MQKRFRSRIYSRTVTPKPDSNFSGPCIRSQVLEAGSPSRVHSLPWLQEALVPGRGRENEGLGSGVQ